VTALAATAEAGLSDTEKERLVVQGLKLVAMHEVGHTLGLRHNFKGSSFRSLAEFNDATQTTQNGGSTSVMDYIPVNIVPKGKPQGEYYAAAGSAPTTTGRSSMATSLWRQGLPRPNCRSSKRSPARSGEPALAHADR